MKTTKHRKPVDHLKLNPDSKMVEWECENRNCREVYATYPDRPTKHCSKECSNPTQQRKDQYLKNIDMFAGGKKLSSKKHLVKKTLKSLPYDPVKYEPKIVDYSYSPNGKAYIGHNKSPFMKTEGKYGFQGVLLQDETRQYVQCYECGKWMKKIGNSHLKKCTKGAMNTTREYKEKYGLGLSQGLVSDETSRLYAKSALKNKMHKKQDYSRLDKMRGKAIKANKGEKHTTAFQNKHATCPLQILTRLVNFINANQELPTSRNRGKSIYKVVRKRFGSFGHGLQSMGLPYFERQGTNYHYAFPDGQVLAFNINQDDQRDLLYQAMVNKCPVLTDPELEKYLPAKTK